MHGSRLVHHWSSTQKVVAFSSAESELDETVESMAEFLFLMNMLKKVVEVNPKDSSLRAAHAESCIVWRQKVRQGESRGMWIQSIVGEGEVTCTKVARLGNPADALTVCDTVNKFSSTATLSQTSGEPLV